ncbi:MAG: hypothetical protein IKQ60_01950 [Candidatus Methanomethylophilaceae archaeon]|nr:hypothetical protein [Candidatus Methanomethylophilaceae archaeon]
MEHEMDRSLIVLAVAVIAVLVIGEAYVYGGAAGVSVRASEDGSYSVTDSGTDPYDVSLIDRHGFPAIKSVTILCDDGYAAVNKVSFVEIGSPRLDQKSYVERLSKNLDLLGFGSHSVADAEAFAESLRSDIASGSCGGKGAVVVSGALPDTVYDGTESSLVLEWMGSGGSLYFVGQIGRYVGHMDGTFDDLGASGASLFIDSDEWSGKSKADGSSSQAWRDALMLRCLDLQGSPCLDGVPDSLGIGYDDGRFSTISMARAGSGQACVFGGGYSDAQRQDVATIIASSMCYCAELLSHDHGEVARGTVKGNLDSMQGCESPTVYAVVGGFFTVQGRAFHF